MVNDLETLRNDSYDLILRYENGVWPEEHKSRIWEILVEMHENLSRFIQNIKNFKFQSKEKIIFKWNVLFGMLEHTTKYIIRNLKRGGNLLSFENTEYVKIFSSEIYRIGIYFRTGEQTHVYEDDELHSRLGLLTIQDQ